MPVVVVVAGVLQVLLVLLVLLVLVLVLVPVPALQMVLSVRLRGWQQVLLPLVGRLPAVHLRASYLCPPRVPHCTPPLRD